MTSAASPAGLASVQILSVTKAPPMDPVPVSLHYFESGELKQVVVQNMRCTHFDDVVVSTIADTLPCFRFPRAPFNSLRSLARNCVNTARQARAAWAGAAVFSDPVLDLRSIVPNNFAHLLLDIVPYALLARQVAGTDVKVLTQPVRGPFLELLNVFGIAPVVEDRRVRAQVIKISGTRGLALYPLLDTFDCNAIHFAPDVYAQSDFSSGPGFARIFLARRAPRSLGNQAEIESITTEYGYKTIFMEDYSVRDQLSIAAQARHVVAVHGAAMSLLLMNKRIHSLVELMPPNVYHQLFPVALGRRVDRYHQVVPQYDPRVAHCGWAAVQAFKNSTFSVDAPLLDSLLGEVHSEGAGLAFTPR